MADAVDPILARMNALHPKVIDLSLDRVLRLLGDLGDPHNALPPVIHVAGTNGKGSVIAFLRAFLEAAGYRVHVYTSPHLVRFAERIRVDGQIISDEALLPVLEEVEEVNAGRPITFFEITTAAAFLAFARTPGDVVLLETGLGGRLDATNVVKRPALTILTPISMDHEQFLGGWLESIAAEKVQIMKPGVGCVVARQERKVDKIVEMRSLELGCPTWREGKEWFVRTTPAGLVYRAGEEDRFSLPAPNLFGGHQVRNAGVALAAIDHLKQFEVSEAALRMGIGSAEWPARMQRLHRGPLVDMLPEGWELWLDGGHNPAAGKMLAGQVRAWRDRPLSLIVGMVGSKDGKGFIEPLAAKAKHIRSVPMPAQGAGGGHSGLDPEIVAQAARDCHATDAATAPGVPDALADIIARSTEPQRVLICGSLYLAGAILAENG